MMVVVPRIVPLDAAAVAGDALRDYRALTDVELRRRSEPQEGIFIAEGELVMRRAIAAGYPVRSVLVSPKWLPVVEDIFDGDGGPGADVPVYLGSEADLQQVTGFHVHRGALASMARRPLPAAGTLVEGARRLVVLEDVNSHTNVGAIFRSAAALGVDGVLLSPSCSDPLYRRAVRVSMGAVFSVPYARVTPWPGGVSAALGEAWHVLALTPDPAAMSLDEVAIMPADKVALLVGCEGTGLSARTRGIAVQQVRIPMSHGVDSLNVAAAVAVAAYALRTGEHAP